jgi:hypothetical protein
MRFFPFADTGPYADLLADGAAEDDRLLVRLRRRDGVLGPVRGLVQIDLAAGTLTGELAAPDPPDQAATNHGG